MTGLGTETAFEVLARARALEAQGRNIVHLEIGEPDFATPAEVTAAAIRALEAGETHYTPSAGIPQLRAAIAADLGRRGLRVTPERVLVTPGAKPIMFYAILALLEAGDEAIFPDPGFPIYASMIRFAGARAVSLPLRASAGFMPDPDDLRRLITKKTKLLILNTPHNPTGSVLTPEVVASIARIAHEHDLWVLSDEIYGELTFGVSHCSPYAIEGMPERTILLDGFSKTFAMTGWRLGYGVFPDALIGPVTRLITNSVSCTSTFVQHAGIEALRNRPPALEDMRRGFESRRDHLFKRLTAIDGIKCVLPAGAFYMFPDIRGLRRGSSAEVADALLNDVGVAALAGTAFGACGEGYLRLSYANSLAMLDAAVERIAQWSVRSA